MSATVNRVMGRREWAMLAVLSLLWGGSFFFIGVAVRELPPVTIVALRVSLAALILLAVVRLTRVTLPTAPAPWRAFLVMGLLNNIVPFCLIVWAQGHIPSGLAAILNATTPLSTVIVAHALTQDEKMTGGRLAGVLIGLGGVTLMVGADALAGLGTHLLAQAAVVGATLSYAFSSVYGRRFKAMGLSPMLTAAGQLSASSLVLVPLALGIDRPWTLPPPSPATWGAILGLVVLSTAVAYILFFRILASAGATNLGLVTFLIPVSAILLGIAFLGESLSARHFGGMAAIGCGLAAIDGRLPRWIWSRLRGNPAREP